MLRLCPLCQTEKPYDPTQKARSRASGFYDPYCWDCHTHRQTSVLSPDKRIDLIKLLSQIQACYDAMHPHTEAIQGLKRKVQQYKLEITKLKASSPKASSPKKPKSVPQLTYAVRIQQAQGALEKLGQLDLSADSSPMVRTQKLRLQHELEVAQTKALRFGANAYDVLPNEKAQS